MSEMKICLNEKEISNRQNISVHKKKKNHQTAINAFKNKAKVFCLANKELWIVT